MSTAINSMANQPNIIGYLEHHKPTTDGSFAICAAGGTGVFVKKASTALVFRVPVEQIRCAELVGVDP